ncbi:hypothetical protein XA68_13343 [Ophiocordyceps unilateralis]|uniref:Uncharacterized protein n=1 Tax=Ophiocordyceps unilateralis TaxID=268505 RepID=A0A2A9PBL8_OPHUN|nr:hypothetical protein XA68_13343 [Ophiocordyceps unilateralis]
MRLSLLTAISYGLVLVSFSGSVLSQGMCKCCPGDDCWPDREEWARLNQTDGGRLVATAPVGSPAGNFDVVVSVTVKAHSDARVAGANFQVINPSWRDRDDGNLARFDSLHTAFPALVNAGLTVVYYAHKTMFGGLTLTGYNMTLAKLRRTLAPLEAAVKSKGFI